MPSCKLIASHSLNSPELLGLQVSPRISQWISLGWSMWIGMLEYCCRPYKAASLPPSSYKISMPRTQLSGTHWIASASPEFTKYFVELKRADWHARTLLSFIIRLQRLLCQVTRAQHVVHSSLWNYPEIATANRTLRALHCLYSDLPLSYVVDGSCLGSMSCPNH